MRDISNNLMWIFQNWFNDQYSQAWPEITINVTWICSYLDYYMMFAKLNNQP